MKKRKRSGNLTRNYYGYIFIAPFFLTFFIFGLYPLMYTIYLSFTSFDGFGTPAWNGGGNYARLFRDRVFYLSLWNTMKIWVTNFIPQLSSALVLAAVFTYTKVRGYKIMRAVYYVPNLVTAATIGVFFKSFLDYPKGGLNQLLMQIGFLDKPMNFTSSPVFMQNMVSLIMWWMFFGNSMIMLIASMTSVSSEYYEAARIDGASWLQVFLKITLPLIKPIMFYVCMTAAIGGLQLFDIPQILSNGTGAPQNALTTTVFYLFNQGFKNYNYGYAATISMGLFFITIIFSVIMYFGYYRKKS